MQVYPTDRNYTETEMGPCFQSQNMCGLPCSNLLSYEWVTSLASTAPVYSAVKDIFSGLHCPSLFSCEEYLLWPTAPVLWRIPSVDTTAPVLWRIPSVDTTAPVLWRIPSVDTTAPVLWRIPSVDTTAPVLWRIPSVDTTAPVHRGIMISPEELSAWGQQQHWGRQTLQTQTFHSSLANPRAEAEGKGCIDGFVWHNTPSNHQHTMNSKHEEILSLFAFKIQTDSHSKWEERTRI